MDEYKIECPVCHKEFERNDMAFSKDCYGITFRLLCLDCLQEIYETKGYDGEYYDELDAGERIDDDY